MELIIITTIVHAVWVLTVHFFQRFEKKVTDMAAAAGLTDDM